MPIINAIAARSAKVRWTYSIMYTALIVGGVSMLYPLGLMLAGSVKSEADFYDNTPLPEYLWNTRILWKKYLESKYAVIERVEQAHGHALGSWQHAEIPVTNDLILANEFIQFRKIGGWPQEWATLGHVRYQDILDKNARLYRQLAQSEFDNNLADYNRACGTMYATWIEVGPRPCDFLTRRYSFPNTPDVGLYQRLKQQVSPKDYCISDPDGAFVSTALLPQWSTIAAYNLAHETHYASYLNVLLSTTAPDDRQTRADWEHFVRQDLGLAFIKVDDSAAPAFVGFLRDRYRARINDLNNAWHVRLERFEDATLPHFVPRDPRARVDYTAFIKERCPLDALRVDGPRQAFERFVGHARDTTRMPIEAVDWVDFTGMERALRWQFLTQNYRFVADYLILHSNGIRNTIIFCSLMILSSLLVNPLAAYALSRYQPPATNGILLFCMATMAFPAEVTMIPSFLLLKHFPIYSLITGTMVALIILGLTSKCRFPRTPIVRGIAVSAVAIVASWWGLPLVAQHIFHRNNLDVSLLNTFWALVIPNVANGFAIFLLKGFFDSLPQELYEAAELDGATEWHKFWIITMNLSKPILAVIALGVFTTAYSEFMMALVIVPDQKMWTMMVWLFQLQSIVHPSVVYASLALAAIPTFTLFLFAQNLILRGIVIPTEK